MGLADQNKRVHIRGGGEGERKIVFFFTNDYKLTLIFRLLKFYGKSKKKKKKERKKKKNTLREVNKKLRFLRVCSFKSIQTVYMNDYSFT